MAKLAGIPADVLAAAGEKLQELENGDSAENRTVASPPPSPQADLFTAPYSHPVMDALEDLEVDSLSPREALDLLYRLKQQI